MIPENNYIHIEKWMTELGLRPIQVWIYAIIHGFCQDGKSTFRGGQSYFREWTGAARSTIIDAIKDMKEKNLIVVRNVTIRNVTYQEYYTVASRAVYQDMAESRRNSKAENHTSMSENQTYTGTKIGHPLSENQTYPRPNSGHNNIANNIFKNAADSIQSEIQTGSPLVDNQNQSGAAAALITKKINELFSDIKIFDSDFLPDLAEALNKSGVGEEHVEAYLQSVFEKTVSKHPLSIPSLFRKLATAPDVIQDFLMKLPKQEKKAEKQTVECPVCGTRVKKVPYCSCPECNLDISDFENIKKVQFERQVYRLPAEDKEKLDKELNEYFMVRNMTDFMNPVKRQEREEKIRAAYRKYGIEYTA